MPTQTQDAITWALTQTFDDGTGKTEITKDMSQPLVDAVRTYFNNKGITYSTFQYSDLVTHL